MDGSPKAFNFMDGNEEGRKGRLVLAAAVGLQFLSGILYIWSVIKDRLVVVYGWTDAEATLPYTLSTMVFALSMFIAGRIQDRRGPRLMASLGSVLLGLGLILSGFTSTVGPMILTFSLMVGAGVGINNAVTTPAAVKWYPPQKKGLITGLVVAGVALASILYSPLIKVMTEELGLRDGLMLLGSGVLVCSLSLAQLIRNPPSGFRPPGSQQQVLGSPAQVIIEEMDWRQMIKTGDFYCLFMMFAFSSSAGLMIIGHLTRIARLQTAWEGGYVLVMLIALFNALGRSIGGTLSDRIGRKTLLRLSFLIQAANMALFGLYNKFILLVFGVALAGCCYGATFSVFPATVADRYGLANFGANYGLVFFAWGLGGVLGPQIAGSLFDSYGNYNRAYLLACLLLLGAAALSFMFGKRNKARI